MINICVTTFNRYDLLRLMLLSITRSHVRPDNIFIVDNGQNLDRMKPILLDPDLSDLKIILSSTKPMGVAESWNYFIRHVRSERIITNDDISFAPDTIGKMVESPGLVVSPIEIKNAFSCFLLRDICIQTVGLFDESISPGYVYFEDRDYIERMKRYNIYVTSVDSNVIHYGSQTLLARPPEEMQEHHRKFLIAQNNYLRKWGSLPDGMNVQH